ncbi:tripartite tricarboxylate transporter TctB family protein [Devosia sp.]|uniref:tripartite tricarboxylate transporter TctB family protein n=1 Tax=Devosia sp. TaxID=1871048 RepID=UPI002FC7C058
MSISEPKLARRPDGAALFIAVILAVIAGVIIWQMNLMRVPPVQQRVGPTVFPYAIAGALILLSIGTVVSALRGSFPAREKGSMAPMVWIVAGLLAQILLLSTAGFAVATGLLFAFTAKGFGRGPLWQTIPIGIVFALLVWFIFARGLQLSLPAGPLERLLP